IADRREPGYAGVEVVLLRLPRAKAVLELLGILGGIARELERFTRQQRGRLMMLPSARTGGRHAGHHIRPNHADQADEVADDLVPPPFFVRLFDAERVPEVDRAGEVLLGPVEAVERGELLGTQ